MSESSFLILACAVFGLFSVVLLYAQLTTPSLRDNEGSGDQH